MKNYFKELFQYSLDHDKKLIKLFGEYPEMLQEKAGELFDHVLNAHHIWNVRVLEKERTLGVWERHHVSNLLKIASENYTDSLEILESIDIDIVLSYTDTKGNSYQNTVKDILFHVVNHGTYHRGQIALEFRRKGIDPIISDYIYYKR